MPMDQSIESHVADMQALHKAFNAESIYFSETLGDFLGDLSRNPGKILEIEDDGERILQLNRWSNFADSSFFPFWREMDDHLQNGTDVQAAIDLFRDELKWFLSITSDPEMAALLKNYGNRWVGSVA